MTNQGFVEKGHIACRYECMGVGGMEEAGVDAPQGSPLLEKIGNHPQIQIQIIHGGVGHQENFIEKIDKKFLRPVNDALAVNFKEGLIFPHTEVFSPCEDDAGNFHLEFRKSFGLRFLLFPFQPSFQTIHFIMQGLVLGLER